MASSTDIAAGTSLGSYTIESVLGRGAASVVYAAFDPRLGRRVALKVLTPPGDDDERFRERFLRESRLAASLDHPNVIPVYEAGEADDVVYIAMRLVRGSDLRAVLAEEGPIEPERALGIVSQAAGALDAAHARGLLHRDVKPANILLAADGGGEHVYLSDFGLAVPEPGNGGLEASRFHGTAAYAAPEQIRGKPEPRSDVYSMACVLFECLGGEPPFGRRRLLETLWAHLNEDPPRLSDRRADLAAADGLFERALAKDPSERPDRCGQLAAEARAALGLDRPSSPARSRFRGVFVAALLTFAAVLLAVAALRDDDGTPAATAAGAGSIETFAGAGRPGSAGDGGPALVAELNQPSAVAIDADGNVFVAEGEGYRVRRVDPDGTITTVAGTGEPGYSGDGGPAAEAEITGVDLSVDPAGRLHLLDGHNPSLRRIEDDGSIRTVAGTGRASTLGNGLRTRSQDLCVAPRGLAFDSAGSAYIACSTAHRVVRVADGVLTTVAGSGEAGYAGDGGPATEAKLNEPTDVAFDRNGNLYIADSFNHRVRKVDADGTIVTIAGTGRPGLSGDGWRATSVDLSYPTAVDVDRAGNVYVVEENTHRVRKIDRNGRIATVAGTGTPGFSGDGGPGAAARLYLPTDVAADASGNVYIADSSNHRIRRVTPKP